MPRLTEQQVEEFYKIHNTPPWVISHCKAVGDVGAKIASALNEKGGDFDVELIRISGYAHDVLRTEEDHDKAMGELLYSMGYNDEAKIIEKHMHYSFNEPGSINNTDIMCLADRVVKEDKYVGIMDRVDYLIHKKGESKERTKHLRAARERSLKFIAIIEDMMGQSLDSLFFAPDELIKRKLDSALKRVEKPARYIGEEKGIVIKEVNGEAGKSKPLRFAFCFPDLYEIGMSYMGLQILYHTANACDDIYLERVFVPAPDMAEIMRDEKLPLFTLETKTPIINMNVLGFTLQYEMSFTNVLDVLELAGIPKLAKDRMNSEIKYPLIVAGGPCAYNPEPLADFIDVFQIGDGEEMLPGFLSMYKESLDKGETKEDFLKRIDLPDGIYIPSQYEVEYKEDGTINRYIDLIQTDSDQDNSLPKRIPRRALLDSLEEVDFPTEPLVPFIETIHDRACVEAFRGCTRGCRFCQAGMIYRPVRERSTERILDLSLKQIESTGNEELSLLSLSSSDYSDFENLAMDLAIKCSDENVALSLPSLRLDTFSFKVLQEIQKYRKSGLTFAPEAGTQRLRDVINKGITEDDIYSAVTQAMDLGWTHIKLYFMIGLPTETYEDLDGIADIAKKIMYLKKVKGASGRFSVTISVSNFVPKAHTPFQWTRQNTAKEFRDKHNYLREKLKIKGVTFNYHDDDTSVLEAILARGDRRVGRLISAAYEKGCKLDSWTEYFDRKKWDEAMEETGILPEFYAFRDRSMDEVLPWDIIDSGILKSFLKSEMEKAKAEITTKDCRYGCVGCGINRRTECKLGGIYE